MSESEEEFYEVDKIVDHKTEGKKTFYKVRWKGYSPSQDTWEPQDHLGEGCDEVIAAYFEWKAANVKSKYKKKSADARNELKGLKGKQPQIPAQTFKPPPKSTNIPFKSTSVVTTLSQEFNQASISKQNIKSASMSFSEAATTVVGAEPAVMPEQERIISFPESSMEVTTTEPLQQQLVSESETAGNDVVHSDTATTDSATDILGASSTADNVKELVKDEMSKCPHQTEYSSKNSQQYRTLSRRYEVKSSSDNLATESQRCVTVLMSRLCDPHCTQTDQIFKELQACMSGWSHKVGKQKDPTKLSLTSALLILSEADVLSHQLLYTDDMSKAIPGNWMPLHFAAALHKFDACDWMLKEGCWSDIVTINQETPLTLALRGDVVCKDSERLLQFVTKLISQGANVQHKDSSGRLPMTMAKKHKYTFVQNLLVAQHQRLMNHTISIMAAHLQTHKDNLFVKEYFLEPQLITQPAGVTYTIRFKFKEPDEPVVARLNVAYYVPVRIDSPSHLSNAPVKLSSDGPFPFKSITLNGHNIRPQNAESKSITLQSQLVVGNNTLELEMLDYSDKRLLDSAMIFGCVIGRSPSL